MKTAALIHGNSLHYLDHLSPLCAQMKIPLIVTEEKIFHTASKYYPDIQIIEKDYLELPSYLVGSFDRVIYCFTRHFFDAAFALQETLANKEMKTIWLPHGNSDKGKENVYFMEALEKEEEALVYGKQMIDFMKDKDVLEKLTTHHIIGNFRYEYFKKRRSFYHSLVEEEVFSKLDRSKTNLFYAPTWDDFQNSGTILGAFEALASNIPEEVNLIVKLHPNTFQEFNVELEQMIHRYEDHPRLLLITTFPAIYPLLDIADVYLGDMSSIGYDFLTFDKPLFFLNPNKKHKPYLYQCGVSISPDKYPQIYKIIQKHLSRVDTLSPLRKKTYGYAFSSTPTSLENI